jgi:signal transduction histidine kinase
MTARRTSRRARRRLLDLERRHERAKKSIRARDDMLAMVSHDLRGPLQTLGLHIDALLASAPRTDRRAVGRARLEAARRTVDRMKRMVTDLLDASRLDAGRFPIRPGEHRVANLVAESVEPFRARLAEKSIELVIALDRRCCCAVVDGDRMIQVFSNLIENAVRFTPERGRISIRASCLGKGFRVSFENSGEGIPPERLEHVFDRYWQAAGERAGAAGLGLYIAKGIVEAHGGKIEATSELGKKTTFHVTLAAKRAASGRGRGDATGETFVTSA